MALELRKLDLHVHTPASHDFKDKAITADQIIAQAQKAGLHAIAITDHNTVDFVDLAKEAAKKKGVTVFPGIEISCGGSQNGSIHVIGLFDPSMSKDDLQKVLGTLGIKGIGENALTSKSVPDVVDIVRKAGGLPVLAHANSSHGALSDIKGNPRTDIVQNENLSAVEATKGDFEKESGKRLVDYLNGDDPTYKRRLAVYKASDNRAADDGGHSLDAIGSEFTYFKMGELTIESLRQCFEDSESRIVQDYETSKINSEHPRLKSMTITGGFLDGQTIEFSPGMNSVIGGTGTGKSLIVEFLRFAFNQRPHEELFNDHKEKLDKQLTPTGEIKVSFRDTSGEEYEVTRRHDGSKDPYNSTIVCQNKTTGEDFKGDVPSIFPVLVYSQNEILEITRDPNAQLHLLDSFHDFESYRNEAKRIVRDLGTLDRQLIDAIEASTGLPEFLKEQNTVEEKIKKLKRQLAAGGKKDIVDEYHKLSDERASIQASIDEYDALIEKVGDTISDFEADTPARKNAPKTLADIITASIGDGYRAVVASLKSHETTLKTAKKKSEADLSAWEKKTKFAQVEKKYQDDIKLQEKQKTLESDRKRLVAAKKECDGKVTAAQQAATRYTDLRKRRGELLAELKKTKEAYSTERSKQALLITERSGGRLRIVLQKADNKDVYLQTLRKLKVRSHAETKEVEEIVNNLSPFSLVEMVLDGDTEALAKAAKLTEQKAVNIINELMDPRNLSGTLAMQYQGYPEDSIEISYQKKNGQYYPLPELSMGQKADALIMIALGDGNMPVIIDQPEDALDVPSIWSDICSKLRVSKHARQFLFTTHNSSISVSSDSDQYIVLEADGTKGHVARSGSIDQKNIKDDIVGHLEGGYGSYGLKRKKYGL